MIRDQITAAQVTAMKAGDKPKTATIRLMHGGDQEPRHRSAHRQSTRR